MRTQTTQRIYSPGSGIRKLKPDSIDREVIASWFSRHPGKFVSDIPWLYDQLLPLGLRCSLKNLYTKLQYMSFSLSWPLKRINRHPDNKKRKRASEQDGWGYVWPSGSTEER